MSPNSHVRKRAQTVEHHGLLLPRGSDQGRLCDLAGCRFESCDLVAGPDGSMMLVCVEHARRLTEPPVVTAPAVETQEAAPVSTPRRRRSVWPFMRVLAGTGAAAWGLAICAGGGSEVPGVLIGAAGLWFVFRTILPAR